MNADLRIAALLAVALCAGCVSIAPPGISAKELASYRVASVDVTVAPDAAIVWNEATAEYVAMKGLKQPPPLNSIDQPDPAAEKQRDAYDAALKSAEARKFHTDRIAARIKPEVEAAFRTGPNGPQPAQLDLTVRHFRVLSAAERVVIGGNNHMVVDTVLRETGGRELARQDGLMVMADNGNGWLQVAVHAAMGNNDGARLLASRYATQFKGWLMPDAP